MMQASTVEIDNRRLRVESELLSEPELFVVTTIVDESGQLLEKQHVAVPAAAEVDLRHRGAAALQPYLSAAHLRVVRGLLSASSSVANRPQGQPGLLGHVTLSREGTVLERAGEEHVPPTWLRSVYLVTALADAFGRRLPGAVVCSARLESPALAAHFRYDEHGTTVRFLACGTSKSGSGRSEEL